MRLNYAGKIGAGVGDATCSQWPEPAPSPVPVGRGAFGGWLYPDSFFGAAPRNGYAGFQPCYTNNSEPWPTFMQPESFQVNFMAAGGGKWIASDGQRCIGTIPDAYKTGWQAHDVGPDGTVVLVLNGVYTVIWPSGDVDSISGIRDIRACEAGIVVTDNNGLLGIKRGPESSVFAPQQLPGMHWWATSVGTDWLLYLADGYGLVLHRMSDSSQGYQWNVAPYSPCGVTLMDGRTVIAWSRNAGEQMADLQRVTIPVLGQGMQPLRPLAVPPEPPNPEPPNPEPPNPEPEPMPPTDPLKPGKTADAYFDALTAVVIAQTTVPAGQAKQGIREAWDQLNAAKDWMSGNALLRGAFCRSGSDAVKSPQTALDVMSPKARAIDLEFLQGR